MGGDQHQTARHPGTSVCDQITNRPVLVVEIKAEADDSNRNRAKCRDGLKHFETLNEQLKEAGEPWRYHFYFLSPEDYTSFFEQIRNTSYVGWRSGLMQELEA